MADDEDVFPSKKVFHLNESSLVDLKAALYRKKEEVRQNNEKTQDKTASTRQVSAKTASIWRREPKKDKRKQPQRNTPRPVPDISREEEEAELKRSKEALEAKAKLYEKLSKNTSLCEDEEGEEDGPRYMVDFQRKMINENERAKFQTKNDDEVKPVQVADEGEEKPRDEWVEYVDSFGRSRSCLKKDLDKMKKLDDQAQTTKSPSRSPSPELLSEDMRRERERQRWEREAFMGTSYDNEDDYPTVGPVHYQDVQHKEVRSHGVGYFEFSVEEAKRQEQMKLLNNLRDNTIEQRTRREKLKEKRKALIEAKLAKVKQRKMKERGETDEMTHKPLTIDIADFDFESNKPPTEAKEEVSIEDALAAEVAKAREKVEDLERAKHVRPWDRGKIVDPIRKRKQELRDERPNEFAPPSSYNKIPKYHNKNNAAIQEGSLLGPDDVGHDGHTTQVNGPPFLPGSQFPLPPYSVGPPPFPMFPPYYPMYYPRPHPPPHQFMQQQHQPPPSN